MAKEPKSGKTAAPVHGVKTPGILIPFASLKPEAEIVLDGPPVGFLFTDAIALADASGIRRFDARTHTPFEPPLDIRGVDKPCGGLLSAFSFVWTASCGASALAKIDMRPTAASRSDAVPSEMAKPEASKAEPLPGPPKPPAFIAIGSTPVAATAVAASEDSIWLLADSKTSLLRIDPATGSIVAEMRLPTACSSILFAEGSLWVTCPSETRILRIDPRTNLVDKRIEVSAQPVSLAAGEASIWVLCRKDGKIARIDPKTNKVAAAIDLSIPNADGMLAFGEGALWASVPGFPVMRITPANDKVAQQFHGEGGGVIHFGMGSVWVASTKSGRVLRYDPKRILATLAD